MYLISIFFDMIAAFFDEIQARKSELRKIREQRKLKKSGEYISW